jgi:hypothetical protein
MAVSVAVFLGVSIIAAACASGAEQVQPAERVMHPADAKGSAVWNYLQEVQYQENWPLWPGKGELYEGTEPHGMLLTTYANQAAFDAVHYHKGSMPHGAIIVMENYTLDETLDSTTIMYKVEGYNPDHNGWFWAKVQADGTIEAEGTVQDCQACHGRQADNDYIWTSALEQSR